MRCPQAVTMPRKKSLVGPTSPSAYAVTSLRSSFGKQCQSGVASSPGASFGSARRDDFDRTYAGRDADRCGQLLHEHFGNADWS